MPPPPPLLPLLFSFVNTFFFLSLLFFPTYFSNDADGYTACAPFSCGNFSNISYPFWSSNQPNYCGHPKFELDCQQDNLIIDINSQKFHVIDIKQKSQLLKIARLDLWGDHPSCPEQYTNVNLDLAFFYNTSSDDSCTLLYDCNPPYTSSPNFESSIKFTCSIDGYDRDGYLVLSTKVGDFNTLGCKNNITVLVLTEAFQSSYTKDLPLVNVLDEGFEVGWMGVDGDKCDGCIESGGRCGYNASQNAFMCLCQPNQQSYGGICSKTSAVSPLQAPTSRPALSRPPLPPYYAPNSEESPHAKSMYSSFS